MAGCTLYRPPKIGHMTIKEKLGFFKTQKLHVGGGGVYEGWSGAGGSQRRVDILNPQI